MSEVKSRTSGELFTLCRSLTPLLGVEGVQLLCEELPPGHRASAPHSHSLKSETHVVLTGEVVAHVGTLERTLMAGDSVAFRGGDDRLHFLENRSTRSALILTIASHEAEDEVRYGARVDTVPDSAVLPDTNAS